MTSLLDFYQQHNISPVRQDITDLPAHFARRAALYRSLGLPPMAIAGNSVLEIGPGTGENAVYTTALKPSRYVLLEPNPTAAQQLDRLNASVVQAKVEDYMPAELFDVVLCEGLLGLSGEDPLRILEAAAAHVRPGGVLVITCIDAISDHAEVLRRAHAQRLIDRSAPLAEQVAVLRPVFAPHLATLKGMTRSVDDWIIDNLLNPASIGPTFSIPEACEALDGRFDVLGSSPRFLTDWRWYKASTRGNQWAIDAYWSQAHNLMDYREVEPPRSERENRELMAKCLRVREDLRAYELAGLPVPRFREEIRLSSGDWFGRGQQYLSFVRT